MKKPGPAITGWKPTAEDAMDEPKGEIILYQTEDKLSRIQVRLEGETVWLTQRQMAELFQKDVRTINEHVQNVFTEGELSREAIIRNFRIVQDEAGRQVIRNVDFYNLDMIISVGYRVKSLRGTQFRIWATQRLREYIVKGFVLDDERLKEGRGLDYFDELLERIRAIRASERRFYQKITDIYATSIDYNPDAAITKEFFAKVQNKLHWAIHGHTAAEIITARADADKPHMGLTTWKNAPAGPIRKADVLIAKNYLTQEELNALNRIVTMYLDYAEEQAHNRRQMTMAEWVKKLDGFLAFNEKNVLTHAGKVTAELAEETATREFEKYAENIRKLEATTPTSDFDRAIENLDLKSLPKPKPKEKTKKGRGKSDKKGGEK
jgi:hypothetical protein